MKEDGIAHPLPENSLTTVENSPQNTSRFIDIRFRMPFTSTCRSISLKEEDGCLNLHAECRCDNGSYRWSSIDLDPCNWRLVDNNGVVRGVRLEGQATLRAECAIKKGAFFWERLEWHESRLNLDDYVRNTNGHLEFLHPKSESMLPEWFHTAVEIADKIANAPEDFEEAYEQYQEEFMQSIGESRLEAAEKEWMKGTLPLKDGRLVRRDD
ncbi:hypothetical protein HGRIS_003055 [Hohenbuehelia grisea]|uniref:Cyanovirin-N domain-containing protein n=1 Tax=Hohenbuehelia grisea TaxID=104357 RepID=A0ABR3JMC5_9AGAR